MIFTVGRGRIARGDLAAARGSMYMNAALLLALSLGAPVEIGKDGKGDKALKEAMEKLQGVWKVTAVESRGRATTPPALNSDRYHLVVDGEAYVFLTHAGTVKLDHVQKTGY